MHVCMYICTYIFNNAARQANIRSVTVAKKKGGGDQEQEVWMFTYAYIRVLY